MDHHHFQSHGISHYLTYISHHDQALPSLCIQALAKSIMCIEAAISRCSKTESGLRKEINVVDYEIYKKNGVVVLTGCFWQRSKSKIRIKIHVTAAADSP